MLIGVASYHGLMRRPTFRRLEDSLPLDELLVELRKPEVKAAILGGGRPPGRPAPPVRGAGREHAVPVRASIFPLGDPPDYEPTADGRSPASPPPPAATRGRSSTTPGRGELLLGAFTELRRGDARPPRADDRAPDTVIGLSDGGAHVKMICDASAPTYLLTHWVRDRTRGDRLPLETGAKKQAAATAAAVGLDDRGTIEVGKQADLNVIDLDNLELHAPRSVDDLPAGGRRILQDAPATATIVRGVVTRRDDSDTGARPGRLVRSLAHPLVELGLVDRALGGMERRHHALLLRAGGRSARWASPRALAVGQLGARVGECGLEVGDVTVRGVEPFGGLGRRVGVVADRLLGLVGPLAGGLELGPRASCRARRGRSAVVLDRGLARVAAARMPGRRHRARTGSRA